MNDGTKPADGIYDLQFAVFDAASNGTQQGSARTNSAVVVSNGLFTVVLDFGNQFPGANRWLEISVRTNGVSAFTRLTPRQALTPAPYAITAGNVATGGLPAGTYGNAVTFSNAANHFTGVFTGDGANLTDVNASTLGGLGTFDLWQLAGNNVGNGQFIGSVNNRPVDIRVNNELVMRFSYASNLNTITPNIVAGYEGNTVSNTLIGATIIGGGALNYTNQVTGNWGTVVGGLGNVAGPEAVAMGRQSKAAAEASIAAGFGNTASGLASIALGDQNLALGDFSTAIGAGSIAAGIYSVALGRSSSSNSFGVAMGYLSVASGAAALAAGDTSHASGEHSTALGHSDANGFGSAALGNSTAANTNSTALGNSIAGGHYSTAAGQSLAVGNFSAALGSATASGSNSVALGNSTASGTLSVALGHAFASGKYSFAAGEQALANHDGTFVWSDPTGGGFYSTAPDQFLIWASGGVGIGINAPAGALHVASSATAPQFQLTQNTSSDYTRLRMNVASNPFWEMDVSPGPTPRLEFWNSSRRMYIDYSGNVSATSFNPSSDRNRKENFRPINPAEVLDKVAALPITEWNFKDDAATTHLGPMAQDFRAAFGLGPDDKHIATVDADGVALAAIQGLNAKLEEQRAQLTQKETEIRDLKARLEKLETLIVSRKENRK